MLTRGATHAIYAAGATAEMIEVPGAFEIPSAIAAAAASGRYGGFVALGCVIRGETTHYDIISQTSARGLMELATRERLAIGNGILTCENLAQAERRADPALGDKGGEAARACLRLIELHQLFGIEA
ncbi:MAG: 6,7-dimethyl-8-ribityllumazine synthase [Alphaproteobacteria bacterium]